MRLFFRPWIQAPLAAPAERGGAASVAEADTEADVADGMSGRAATAAPDTDDDTPSDDGPIDIRQAFRKAVEKHSSGDTVAGEHADAPEATAPKRRGTTSTTGDDAEPEARGAATTTTAETGLITDEEFTALSTKHKDDPAALRRELEKAFTQKTQKLAEDRRSLTRLSQYTDLIDALEDETTAPAAIRQLATEFNVKLGEVSEAHDAGETTAADTAEATQALVDEFREALGPELEYLADGLAPAVKQLVEKLTGATISKELGTVKTFVKTQSERQAQAENDQIFDKFGQAHPDWKTHEDAMFTLSKRLQPAEGMTELEYLEVLYTQVTAPKGKADIDKRVNDEIAAREKKRQQRTTRSRDEVDERLDDAPADRVVRQPQGLPTLRESFDAAKAGTRW